MTLARHLLSLRYEAPTKYCSKCVRILPLAEFRKSATSWCRACSLLAERNWFANEPEWHRRRRRMRGQLVELRAADAYDPVISLDFCQPQLDPREELELQEMAAFATE